MAKHNTATRRNSRGYWPTFAIGHGRAVFGEFDSALDEVESTLGHFASYLNDWSRVPTTNFTECPSVPRLEAHSVHRGDIFDLLPRVEADLAYFDPPYGSNNEKMPPSRVRYAAYYHLWTTICMNDKPSIFGKAKRRVDSSDTVACSAFEEFRKSNGGRFMVIEAIERLLKATCGRHIILSYSSGGRATAEELNEVISSVGQVLEVLRWIIGETSWRECVDKRGCRSRGPNREFLFLIEKSKRRDAFSPGEGCGQSALA